MGAVERIFPGHLYLVPDFLRLIVRASVPDGSGNEIRLQRGHQVGFLLSYGLAQEVGLPEVESPERMGDGHELLLVDHDSESVLRRFITAVVIDRGHLATPETDIIIGGADVERGGAVQGIDGDQVLDTLRLYILDKPGNAR